MSKPVNKTVIGLFVVVAVGLVVLAVAILGSGKFFQDKAKFVMYFEGSVKGLAVGSPVVFRGVRVGTVTDVGMLFNQKDLSVLIPVHVEIGEADVQVIDGFRPKRGDRKKVLYGYLDALIKQGLRAQLEMQSFVTGQLLVALDFYPEKPAKFVHVPSKYPEIPTIPTQLQLLTRRMEQIPIEQIAQKMQSTLDGIERLVNSPETARMAASIAQTFDETRALAHTVENQVGPLVKSLTKTSDEAVVTLQKVQLVARSIEKTAGEDSPVVYRLNKTLTELERTSRSLRFLAETLEEQPESLIFGKKTIKGGSK
ncbi:MAG: MlaD family protein [Syntrophorhabdaceae bacterium]|nr:MlaD family protein [Syntrophorhabdaceae bacterium]MDD4195863.1 MlaD family protein [Syntrophorhabdaceae bacterium]